MDTSPTAQRRQPHARNVHLLASFLQMQGVHAMPAQLVRYFEDADEPALVSALKALRAMGFRADVAARRRIAAMLSPQAHLTVNKQGQLLIVSAEADGMLTVHTGEHPQPARVHRNTFEAQWGACWIVARRAATESLQAQGSPARFGVSWFLDCLARHRLVMGEVLLASLFVQLLSLLSPLIFQVVIDKVLTHRSMSTLDVMVIALVGASVFEVVLSALRHYLFSHTTNRIDVELGAKLFARLLSLPLSYFEARRSGDTVARVRELENARSFLTGQALTSWLDLAFAAAFIAVMLYYSPSLTLVVLLALPVFFAASWLVTPLLRRKLEDRFALAADNQAFLVETVTSMETLKAQAVESHWQRDWERRLADYVNASFNGGHLAQATNQFIGLCSKLLTAALLWFGARQVIDGELTVGGLIAFNMLAARVNAPILKLSSLWQEFTQMKVSIKRLADIMDASGEPGFEPGRSALPTMQGKVRFEQVSFRYSPKASEVLCDLDFEVHPGEVIGIVGLSGAGKTTLMRLIQRLYSPERGRVLIDGVDLNLADATWLRRQLGVVGQDTALFNRSVRENIALGQPSLPMQQVWRAAQLAGAHEFILGLPEGYDTVIGERGSRLSGGQRSRIAIARSLAHDPRLLLLDEATAALDYESERVVHDNLAQIAQGRTVFIVAHRLSTLRLADRILVLEKGRLVQAGSHAALMGIAGRYRDLYRAHQAFDGRDALAAGAAHG